MSEEKVIIATATAGRIDHWLCKELNFSRSKIGKWIKLGLVLVNGQPVRASFKPKGGEVVTISIPQTSPTTIIPQDIPLDIHYLDNQLLVVNKPAGMVVHPAEGNWEGTLANGIVHLIQKMTNQDPSRPGIVHRIDKGTSGLLVIARTELAMKSLATQFANHSIHRVYLALVWGKTELNPFTISGNLGRHPKNRKKMAIVEQGKHAVTHCQPLAVGHYPGAGRPGDMSLVQCQLETGRTHQIRVHLSSRGHHLVGDPVYTKSGQKSPTWQQRLDGLNHQLLHAWQLGFNHPTKGEMMFQTPPPSDFLHLLATVGIKKAPYTGRRPFKE